MASYRFVVCVTNWIGELFHKSIRSAPIYRRLTTLQWISDYKTDTGTAVDFRYQSRLNFVLWTSEWRGIVLRCGVPLIITCSRLCTGIIAYRSVHWMIDKALLIALRYCNLFWIDVLCPKPNHLPLMYSFLPGGAPKDDCFSGFHLFHEFTAITSAGVRNFSEVYRRK